MKKTAFFIILLSVLLFVASCGTFTYTGEYCEDGIQDRYETDIDCGGRYCDPCVEGSSCEEDSDCESDSCVDDVCAAAVEEEAVEGEEAAEETVTEGEEAVEEGATEEEVAESEGEIATDSDGDGYSDSDEVAAGSDSLDSADDPTDYCTDTDGGYNYLEKGTVSGGTWWSPLGEIETTYTPNEDYCDTTGKVKEYYCHDADSAFFTIKSCETVVGEGYSCSDGACVSS